MVYCQWWRGESRIVAGLRSSEKWRIGVAERVHLKPVLHKKAAKKRHLHVKYMNLFLENRNVRDRAHAYNVITGRKGVRGDEPSIESDSKMGEKVGGRKISTLPLEKRDARGKFPQIGKNSEGKKPKSTLISGESASRD